MPDVPDHFVLDGHNDLPAALRETRGYRVDGLSGADGPVAGLHTDIARLRAGGVGAQFWSVWVPDTLGDAATAAVLDQIDAVDRLVAAHPDDLAAARMADDVVAARAAGRIACLKGAEGGAAIAGSLGVLRQLARLGVRYMTLTHNHHLAWASSATDTPRDVGLTDFGRQVVAEMNRIGMIVDLSHVAPATMRDALDVTTEPVLFSHSSSRAVCDHPRCVPDDVLERLPANGGVQMLTFVASFVSPVCAAWRAEHDALEAAAHPAGAWPVADAARQREFDAWLESHPRPHATLDDVVAHVEHSREVAGIDHIGLGGDFDGTDWLPDELGDVSSYPRLLDALRGRGWSGADLDELTHGNVLRVLRAADVAYRAWTEDR